jgi:hypothetical protein
MMTLSKERLLREAVALRELARHARYVMEMSSDDHQKEVLRRHANEFDKRAGLLESEAAHTALLRTDTSQSTCG